MSLFYHKPGLQCPNAPPRLPIPDAKRITNQSPIVQAQVRRLNLILRIWEECSGVFPCICQCWSISPELALLYRHKGPLKGDRRTFCLAELKFRELLGWSNRLPRRLCRNDQSPHYVQILQYEPPLSVAQRRRNLIARERLYLCPQHMAPRRHPRSLQVSTIGNIKSLHLRTSTSPYSTLENACIASASPAETAHDQLQASLCLFPLHHLVAHCYDIPRQRHPSETERRELLLLLPALCLRLRATPTMLARYPGYSDGTDINGAGQRRHHKPDCARQLLCSVNDNKGYQRYCALI
jgi:hypothetical protein